MTEKDKLMTELQDTFVCLLKHIREITNSESSSNIDAQLLPELIKATAALARCIEIVVILSLWLVASLTAGPPCGGVENLRYWW
ncbi:MAG: hypothetical protein ACYC0Q_03150 [Eubacteriales bacterium]|nr:hypothetical protein [Bacillota bacterium]